MESFCRRDFPSGSRLLAKGILHGTAETKAEGYDGKAPGPSGWLTRPICHVERLARMLKLRHAPLSLHLFPREPTELVPVSPEAL